MKYLICFTMLVVLTVTASAQTADKASTLSDAMALIRQNQCVQAIQVLEEIAASDPASAEKALGMIGRCHSKLGNWGKAIESYQRLLADHGDSMESSRQVRISLMDCYLANKQQDKANALFGDLLKESQDDAWKLHFTLGRRHLWAHAYAQAIPELEQAVQLGGPAVTDPAMAEAETSLLRGYVEAKKWTKAEAFAKQLLVTRSGSPHTWNYELGRAYQGMRQYKKSIAALQLAFEQASEDPKNAEVAKIILRELYTSYDLSGDIDKAVVEVEKIVQANPNDPVWCWELARRYRDKREFGKAVPLFEKAIQSSDARWIIRSSQEYLGDCLFKLGRGDEALRRMETYYSGKSELKDEYLLVKAAVLYYGASDDVGCLASVDQLLAYLGSNSPWLADAGKELQYKALKRKGQVQQAASILEQLATQSSDPYLLLQVGDDYFSVGSFADAGRVFERVSQSQGIPSEIAARSMFNLGVCYSKTNRKEEAKRVMEQASIQFPDTDSGIKARNWLAEPAS